MVGVDLGLNTIFEVLGRIAEVALDVVLRVAAHAFQGSRHGPHQGFLLLRLIERPGGFEVVDVSLVHRGHGIGNGIADFPDEPLRLDVLSLGECEIIRGCHNRDRGTAENERLRDSKFIFSYPKNERLILLSGRNAAQEEISTMRVG